MEDIEGPTNQAALIINKVSLAPIETAHGELKFDFISIIIKVNKSDSNTSSCEIREMTPHLLLHRRESIDFTFVTKQILSNTLFPTTGTKKPSLI